MTRSDHPPDGDLQKWLYRELPPDRYQEIADHLNRGGEDGDPCPHCPQRFSQLARPLQGPSRRDEPPRLELNGYSNVQPVDQGGMGIVYRAFEDRWQRWVAIKVIRPSHLGPGAKDDFLARFEKEALITAQLQEHPGVAPVYASGITPDDNPYYTMKFIPGETLGKRLARRPADRKEVSEFVAGLLPDFLRVCDAVAFAHEKRIIHRDLKPSNVMLGSHRQVLTRQGRKSRHRGSGREAAKR